MKITEKRFCLCWINLFSFSSTNIIESWYFYLLVLIQSFSLFLSLLICLFELLQIFANVFLCPNLLHSYKSLLQQICSQIIISFEHRCISEISELLSSSIKFFDWYFLCELNFHSDIFTNTLLSQSLFWLKCIRLVNGRSSDMREEYPIYLFFGLIINRYIVSWVNFDDLAYKLFGVWCGWFGNFLLFPQSFSLW